MGTVALASAYSLGNTGTYFSPWGWVMTLVKYCVLGNIYFVMLGVFAGGAALASLVWM